MVSAPLPQQVGRVAGRLRFDGARWRRDRRCASPEAPPSEGDSAPRISVFGRGPHLLLAKCNCTELTGRTRCATVLCSAAEGATYGATNRRACYFRRPSAQMAQPIGDSFILGGRRRNLWRSQ
eukprot:1090377-Pyramimonas_sp.AAC.1